jgi:hypothetical protein
MICVFPFDKKRPIRTLYKTNIVYLEYEYKIRTGKFQYRAHKAC